MPSVSPPGPPRSRPLISAPPKAFPYVSWPWEPKLSKFGLTVRYHKAKVDVKAMVAKELMLAGVGLL